MTPAFDHGVRTMKKFAVVTLGGAFVAAASIGYLGGQQQTGKPIPVSDKDVPDTNAIRKAGQSFLKAYLSGDAKAVAAHWTENGEYFADDGTVLRGRAEIEKSYAELFTQRGGYKEAG